MIHKWETFKRVSKFQLYLNVRLCNAQKIAENPSPTLQSSVSMFNVKVQNSSRLNTCGFLGKAASRKLKKKSRFCNNPVKVKTSA